MKLRNINKAKVRKYEDGQKLDYGSIASGVGTLGTMAIDIATMDNPAPSKAATAGKGALSGMATGASMGAAGGPMGVAIGAGVGLLAGGAMGLWQGGKEEDAYKAEQKKKEELANTQRTMAFNQSSQANLASANNRGFSSSGTQQASFYGKNGGLLKSIKYLKGGELQPVSKNTQLAVGQSHENGGIKLDAKSEIEGGETLVDKGDHTLVVSDNLVNPLSGNTFAKDDLKLAKTLGRFEGKTSNLAKNSIKQINAKREMLHNMQQKMNGDATDNETLEAKNGMKLYGDGGKTTKKQYINIADKYHDIEKRGKLDSLFNTSSGKAYHTINQKVFGSVNKPSTIGKRTRDKSKTYSNFNGNPADRFPASRDSSGYEQNSELYLQKARANLGIDEYIKGNTLNIDHIDNGRSYSYEDSYLANRAKEVQKAKDVVKAKPAVKIPIAENKKQPIKPTVKPPIVKPAVQNTTITTSSVGNMKTNPTGGDYYSNYKKTGTANLGGGYIVRKGSNGKIEYSKDSGKTYSRPTKEVYDKLNSTAFNGKLGNYSEDMNSKRTVPSYKGKEFVSTTNNSTGNDPLGESTYTAPVDMADRKKARLAKEEPKDYTSLNKGLGSLAKLSSYVAPHIMDWANENKNIARLKAMNIPDAPQQGFANLAKQNMEVDRAEIRKQQGNYNAGISGTLADSQTAALMKANMSEKASGAISGVNQNQRNANTQISNAQTEMNLGIDARNKAGIYAQKQQQMEKDVDISNRTAGAKSKLLSGLRDVQNTYREEGVADKQFDIDYAGLDERGKAYMDKLKATGTGFWNNRGTGYRKNGGKLTKLAK